MPRLCTQILALTFLLAHALVSFAAPSLPKRTIPFRNAQQIPHLKASIVGAFSPGKLPNFIDRDGIHYGRCMAAIVQNTGEDTVWLTLPCGTRLIPENDSAQVMLVTHDVEFPVPPGEEYASKFYAVCIQLHRQPPTADDGYAVGSLADSALVQVARTMEASFAQNMIGQHAAWAVSDSVTAQDLKPYGATEASIAQTLELLDAAGVKTNLQEARDSTSWGMKAFDWAVGAVVLLLVFSGIPYLVKKLLFARRRSRRRASLPANQPPAESAPD